MKEFDKQQVEELSDFLCVWCHENGTPFTRITYSVDSGLKIDNDDSAEARYYRELQELGLGRDEVVYDDNGNPIGVRTVAVGKQEKPVKTLREALIERLKSNIDYLTERLKEFEVEE